MLTLGIDTSDGTGVALVRDGDVLARADGADPRRHVETLAPAIDWVLAESGADRRDLGAVVVGTGPAPFTGLRVGLVTAHTLGRALRIPVVGVCSLDALARAALDALDGVEDVVVVTDARRREVYAAHYRPGAEHPGQDVSRLAGPVVAAPADLRAALGLPGPADGWHESPAFVGRGAALYPEALGVPLGRPNPGAPAAVDAAVLARLGLHRRATGGETSLEPRYLRRPDVTPAAARKRVS